jgi:hypothetical protein
MAGRVKKRDRPWNTGRSATETPSSGTETQSFGTKTQSLGTETLSFGTEAQSLGTETQACHRARVTDGRRVTAQIAGHLPSVDAY